MKYRNLLFFVLFISTLPVTAQQITQWHGEGRRGINDGKMELLSTFKIDFGTKEHFSHPVIADGVLYLRRGPVLRAWDINK